MTFKSFLFAFVILWSNLLHAQQPIVLLNQLGEKQPIQKIYLHTDRENYMAGQTAFFTAYLNSNFLPDTKNTTMYVELLNGTQVINKYAFPVFFSSTTGSVSLPDTLTTGYYTLRSFSAGMMAQNNDYFFYQKIFVQGRTPKQIPASNDTVQLAFFAEGGNLVNGLSSTIAFKANDKNGMPINIEGELFDSKNTAITTIASQHNGMGTFEIEPTIGEKYYIKLKNKENKYYLPEVLSKGIALSIIAHPDGSFFEILQKPNDTTFAAAYMVGQMQHHVVFKKEFLQKKESLNGIIKTKNLPSGIMQITVFNKNNMPLAERLCFINNNEYKVIADIKTDTLDFNAGAKNKIFISLKDTIQGQISVSVTDNDFNKNSTNENNIISSLLLTSDLRGYVHNASWYLSSDEDSVKNALDVLMMVNGWRRFTWAEIANQPKIESANKAFITLNGKAYLQGRNKTFANKSLLLMINSLTQKNKRSTHFLQTDKAGNFKLDSLYITNKNRLLFMDPSGRNSRDIDIFLDADTLFAGIALPKNVFFNKNITTTVSSKMEEENYSTQKKIGALLAEVKVLAKKKSIIETIEEKYTSGVFGGEAAKILDLINTDDATTYGNIFEYLQFKVPGLSVQISEDMEYVLHYRQMPTASSLGNPKMIIYLDEMETDGSLISNIPAHQIALVKVYSSFVGADGNAPGGAISIYTKKAEDYTNFSLSANLKMYNGYSVAKEFYAPNYSVTTNGLENDNRVTLDWRPQIFVNNINPQIPISFFNNNRTKSFKIVVEGMTITGKLIWIEKLLN
ncbi:MAG: hypothetical protein ABL929_02815 [Ferruginibacter sp.]|nr:hypothetical protein [Ferruginibacter sp.]NOU38861.1 hypothetical protein [Ferruginibacter sp.]